MAKDGRIFPGPMRILGIVALALGAIWLANNVDFVANVVRPRRAAA